MLSHLPFLVSNLSYGVIALLIFLGSAVILPIPVLASRGGRQVLWFLVVGFLLTAEAVALIVLGATGTKFDWF